MTNEIEIKIMKSRFECYKSWCRFKGLKPSNPDTLKAYLRYLKEDE